MNKDNIIAKIVIVTTICIAIITLADIWYASILNDRITVLEEYMMPKCEIQE